VSIDAGIKAVHKNANYSLIGFWSDYNDFSQLEKFDSIAVGPGSFTPLWRFENVEDVTIYGFEGVVEGNLNNGLYGSLSFSYQRGDNNTKDQPIFVSPIKTILTTGYRHHKQGLFGEITVRRAEDQNRIPDATTLDDIATRGFTVVSATTGIRLYDRIRVSVTGSNLFDETYSEPFNGRNPDNPIPESGRSFIFSLTTEI
jgi:outer membrane receptor protein involved in Fe transport